MSEVENSEILNNLVPDEDSVFDPKIVAEIEATETPPHFASPNWHEYVMRQFEESELENGNPIRDGLVRVTENLIGPIVKREVLSFQASNDEHRHFSTVHIRITIAIKNPLHPLFDDYKELIEDGIAETNNRNTPAPYHLHPSATSSSKAEAQALRKALRLRRTVSADEITPEEMVMEDDLFIPDQPVTPEQINVIDLLAKRLNINLLEFVNSGETKYAFVEQVPSSKALRMIKFLTEIQSGKQKSPTSKQYDPSWRQKEKKVSDES